MRLLCYKNNFDYAKPTVKNMTFILTLNRTIIWKLFSVLVLLQKKKLKVVIFAGITLECDDLFTCLKSTAETLEKDVKFVWFLCWKLWTYFTPISNISIGSFVKVKVCWGTLWKYVSWVWNYEAKNYTVSFYSNSFYKNHEA